MKKPVFTGANVAIITPMTATGDVNYPEFKKIIDDQIARGIDSITICGTTGEGSTLTDKEHKEAIQFCIDYVNGRVPVIAGTGSNDTRYAIELCEKTRIHPLIELGISPRGVAALVRMARASAVLHERNYVVPEDIQSVFLDVCAHRLVLRPQARVDGMNARDVLRSILSEIRPPVLSAR